MRVFVYVSSAIAVQHAGPWSHLKRPAPTPGEYRGLNGFRVRSQESLPLYALMVTLTIIYPPTSPPKEKSANISLDIYSGKKRQGFQYPQKVLPFEVFRLGGWALNLSKKLAFSGTQSPNSQTLKALKPPNPKPKLKDVADRAPYTHKSQRGSSDVFKPPLTETVTTGCRV